MLSSIPSGALYTNVRSPRAYRSATPGDIHALKTDPVVESKSCQRSLLYLISWGDNSYARAVENVIRETPDAVLYDVQIDSRVRSILLGLYADNCTFLTGRLSRLQ